MRSLEAAPSKSSASASDIAIKVCVQEFLLNPVFLSVPPEKLAEAAGLWILCRLYCRLGIQLPPDAEQMSHVLRVTPKSIARVWKFIESDFRQLESGAWVHRTTESERTQSLEISEKRRQSAHLSWRNRQGTSGKRQGPKGGSSEGPASPPSMDAMSILEAWNAMVVRTHGALAACVAEDLPEHVDELIPRVGGVPRVLQAIDRLPSLPFYLGSGASGWRASLPWLLSKKESISNLLAQNANAAVHSGSDNHEDHLSDSDRALLEQLRMPGDGGIEN